MSELSDDMRDVAADYVIGQMPEGEARLVEALMARDPAFAAYIGTLRDGFLPLDLSAEPRALPEGFVERVTGLLNAPGAPEVISPVVAPSRPANDPSPPRSAVGLIAAAVAGLAIGFGAGWLRPMPEPMIVAVLLDDQGVPQAIVEDYGNDSATVRFVADVDVPADRSLQVWTLPSPEIGATSLGVLDKTAPTYLTFDDLPGPGAQQLYEITLEPIGGSPTGRPTGPIVGKGYAAPQV